jgi:hypothetical protein
MTRILKQILLITALLLLTQALKISESNLKRLL